MENILLDKSMEGFSGRIPVTIALVGSIVIENGVPRFECDVFRYTIHRGVRGDKEVFSLTADPIKPSPIRPDGTTYV